jgi:hypothetical protein
MVQRERMIFRERDLHEISEIDITANIYITRDEFMAFAQTNPTNQALRQWLRSKFGLNISAVGIRDNEEIDDHIYTESGILGFHHMEGDAICIRGRGLDIVYDFDYGE